MPPLPPGQPQTSLLASSTATAPASCATTVGRSLTGRLPPHAGLALVLQAVALALDVDRVRVMQQTIENGAGDDVVLEDSPPFAVALVGGQDHRATLVAFADQLEQERGCLPVQVAVADLIEDEQAALAQMSHFPAHTIFRLRLRQAIEQIRQTDEVDTEAITNGFHPQRDCQVRLAHSGRARNIMPMV